MIKNLKLNKKIELVDRGLGAEIFSGIVNGIGALLALTAMILVIVFSASSRGKGIIICSVFYGVTLFLAYLFSCLYHSLAYNDGKRIFRFLTITIVDFLFTSCIMIICYKLFRDKLVLLTGISMGISLISTLFNILNFEKYRYVRIVGFLFQTIIALFVIYKSLVVLPFIAFALVLVAVITFIAGFIFHIFGYQLSYLNSIGHIFVLTGNAFLFFTILLYII